MKKLLTTLFIASLFLIQSVPSFAEKAVEDPDLQLSIEELRKKYPIGWLKEKYGEDFCPGYESFLDGGGAGGIIGIYYSVDEVKSIFSNINFDSKDDRLVIISGLVLTDLKEAEDYKLSGEEKDIKRFIYSEKIFSGFQASKNCLRISGYFPELSCSYLANIHLTE